MASESLDHDAPTDAAAALTRAGYDRVGTDGLPVWEHRGTGLRVEVVDQPPRLAGLDGTEDGDRLYRVVVRPTHNDPQVVEENVHEKHTARQTAVDWMLDHLDGIRRET
jgi:hypothetical protein